MRQEPPKANPEIQILLDRIDGLRRRNELAAAEPLAREAMDTAKAAGDASGEAGAMMRLGTIRDGLGAHDEGIGLIAKAAERFAKLGDRLQEGRGYNLIGISLKNRRLYPEAKRQFDKAQECFTAVGAESDLGGTLSNVALIDMTFRRINAAIRGFEEALVHIRKGKNIRYEFNVLSNLSTAYQSVGRPEDAMSCLEQARVILTKIGTPGDEVNLLTNIGALQDQLGRPNQAIATFQEGLAIARRIRARTLEARLLGNIGNVQLNAGQTPEARKNLAAALRLAEGQGAIDEELYLRSRLASTHERDMEFPKALALFRKNLEMAHAAKLEVEEGQALVSLADIYINLDQVDTGLGFLKRGIPLLERGDDRSALARAYRSMGLVDFRRNSPLTAKAWLEKSLENFRAVRHRLEEAQTLRFLGTAEAMLGRRDEARKRLQEALQIFHATDGTIMIEGVTESELGRVFFAQGNLDDAERHFDAALGLARSLGRADLLVDALTWRAQICGVRNDIPGAVAMLKEAVDLLEKRRAMLIGFTRLQSSVLASNRRTYFSYVGALNAVGDHRASFEAAQKTKARTLVDLMAAGNVALDGKLTDAERSEYRQLRQEADQINVQMIREGVANQVGAKARFAALRQRLQETEARLQGVTDKIRARHPELAHGTQSRTATLPEVAAALGEDTVLLEFAQSGDQAVTVFAVFLEKGKPRIEASLLPVPLSRLEAQCAAFRDACADPRKAYQKPAASLYAQIVAPVAPYLNGKKRVVVCPDGPLWDVPFQALLFPGPRQTFLAQRHEIAYAPSATAVLYALQKQRGRKPERTLLALANPDFGSSKRFEDIQNLPGQRPIDSPSRPIDTPSRAFDSPSRAFDSPSRAFDTPSRALDSPSRAFDSVARAGRILPLPGTQKEADALKRNFPSATVLTGRAAQEAVARKEAGRYRFLHFATHGIFNDAAPMLSSVVLAQPVKGSRDDGFLTAREIFGMDLSAEMAVLSACNSGRGVARTGEGLVGLTWALSVAGCPTQVVSQWAVDDASTALLMTRFYANLKGVGGARGKGSPAMGKGAALRKASLSLMADPKRRHPYHWAPFVLVGDWR